MIGIFDSGLGGLTVVRELLRRSPTTSFVYLGDTARVPYGNKSHDTICAYAIEDVSFLQAHGATDIVIACNTVSAHALSRLRETFPHLRFFDVITPAIEAAMQTSATRIGVIGTRATIGSDVYAKQILARDSRKNVFSVACPLFVPLVEEGWIKHVETKRIVRRYLASLRQHQIDTLILGCTHYPLLQSVIRSSLQKRVRIIDSPCALWDMVARTAPELLHADQPPTQEYYFTDLSDRGREMAHAWLRQPIVMQKADLTN